jgi:hypothetical protein
MGISNIEQKSKNETNITISRPELVKRGFQNFDKNIINLLGLKPDEEEVLNHRLWIAYKNNGKFIIYNDLGNGWCSIVFDSES